MKLTAVNSGYWKVRVNGVVVSQHTTERGAVGAAVNCELANPADVVEYFHDAVVRVEADVVPVPDPEPEPIPEPTPEPTPEPIPEPIPKPVSALIEKYRYQSGQLFQTARSRFEPSHLMGGGVYGNEKFGPSHKYVTDGWEWDTPGGDWLDAAQTRQGLTPWFSVLANQASGSTAVYAYSVDCTTALQFIQAQNRWNAFVMRSGAPRNIAGVFSTAHAKPAIDVVYADGTTGVLNCLVTALSDSTTYLPSTTAETIKLPAFLEFDKPAAAVQSATMTFTITAHWSGSNQLVSFFILDPSINSEPVQFGIAATAPLDAGLADDPSIIGRHDYSDGTQLSDFVYPGFVPNLGAASSFDPYIYREAPDNIHDYTKYPHLGLGKFIPNKTHTWEVVDSGFAGDGFEPLTSGLGALRVPMVHNPVVVEGYDQNRYGGTSGANAFIFMPEPIFGYLDHIFVRYYQRIGTPNGSPYRMPIAQRWQMRQSPETALIWADCAGKTGVTPSHKTTNGGNSGGSGGGVGWQLRHSWADCTTDETGPEVDGWRMGVHMWDFLQNNPVGYQYGERNPFNDSLNKGGLGGTMHADMWYCVETELKLNTVFDAAPGYTPDGELRVWVDGRLALEKTGMVFRTLPRVDGTGVNPVYQASRIQPIRELGIKELWFNWFHGGQTQNTLPRTMFVTGLAWGTKYIGPMQGVKP